MHISADKVLENGTANTTVSFTLAGAITGFRTFASQLATNDTCFYSAFQVDASGNPTGNWENGLATLSAGTTLDRTAVVTSSNSDLPVTFTGTVWVGLTLLASQTAQFDSDSALSFVVGNIPSNTAAGIASLFAQTVIAGNTEFWRKDESGKAVPLQDSFAFTRVQKWTASNNTIVSIGCPAPTLVGSGGAQSLTTGSAKNNKFRMQLTGASTAGALASIYTNTASAMPVFRGGANGEGGFRNVREFSLQALPTGVRGFFGYYDVSTIPTNIDPLTSTTPGKIGIGFNANTGNWQLINNITGTAPTVLDLGANFPINTADWIKLIIFAAPFNGSAQPVYVTIERYTTNPNVPAFSRTEVLSTNIPAAATNIHPVLWMCNNLTASSAIMHFGSLTTECDN